MHHSLLRLLSSPPPASGFFFRFLKDEHPTRLDIEFCLWTEEQATENDLVNKYVDTC